MLNRQGRAAAGRGGRVVRAVLATLCLTVTVGAAQAHKASASYLSWVWRDGVLQGQVDLAVEDLRVAVQLDTDGNGRISSAEMVQALPRIDDYLLSKLTVRAGAQSCQVKVLDHRPGGYNDGVYDLIRFRVDCPQASPFQSLQADYRAFFELDKSHRAWARVQQAESATPGQAAASASPENDWAQAVTLDADHSTMTLNPPGRGSLSLWDTVSSFWREGVHHIVIGVDHMAFLLALLLPALGRREGKTWHASPSLRATVLEVAAVVTAFTLAHSVTLALAVLGWVDLPSRWVEAAIALTVLLAALNNLRPVLTRTRWVAALLLGLVHGFGFAGALVALGLPAQALTLALLSFNLGVETGQLLLVLAFVALCWRWRATVAYQRLSLFSSVLIALLGLAWLLQRGLDLPLPL